MKTKNKWERFLGLTLNINPAFNLIGIIGISINRREKFKSFREEIKNDRVSLYMWAALAVVGLISIMTARDSLRAISAFFIPFIFVGLYILGRFFIVNPVRFFKDMVLGTAVIAFLTIIFRIFEIELVISGIELIGRFGGGRRGYIFGMGDNGLAVLLQPGIIAALGLLFVEKGREEKIKYFVYFLISLGALIITNSRGGMLGTAVGIIVLSAAISWKIIALSGGAAALALTFIPRFLNRIKTLVNIEEMNRMNIYKGVLKMIADNLWFGVGPGNFNLVYPEYRLAAEYEHAFSPHSNYLLILSEWGIFGTVLLYGWLFFVLVRGWFKNTDWYKKIMIAVLISFWIHVVINDLFAAYAGILLGCVDNAAFNNQD